MIQTKGAEISAVEEQNLTTKLLLVSVFTGFKSEVFSLFLEFPPL